MTTYLVPTSVDEAIRLLDAHHGDALIVAGGTDVMPDIRRGRRAPACLVDITRIPALTEIRISDDYVEVGGAVTFAMLREHPYLQQHVHVLVEAAGSVGAAPIQSAATWAGNLVQAMPAADGAISALALDAELHVLETTGTRWLPVAETFLGPGRSAIDSTRQLIAAVRFPAPVTPWGTAWRRAGRRPSLILPTLNCAVKLALDEDRVRIADAAIALGPVAATPLRAIAAEALLIGRMPTSEAFTEAARLAQSAADPRSSIHRASRAYRLAILPALVADALATAAQRAMCSTPDSKEHLP